MSFPRYPSYKDSGVEWLGEVPEHWEVKRLRVAAELNPSKSEIGHLDRATVVTFLPMEAIGDDGTLALDREKQIGEAEGGYTYFRDGDVTIAKITPCYENGKGALMKGLVNGIGFGTTELIVARPRLDHIVGAYLYYIFISSQFRRLGESHMHGAGGQKRVPDAFVRDFATAFPPVSEQIRIAAFLDRETAEIDGLVAEQRRLMELLKEKRQAVISHAVTRGLNPDAPMKPSGIEWLGDVPEHWDVMPLKYSITKVEQGWSPQCESEPAGLDEWGVLKVGCGNHTTFDPMEQKALPLDIAPLPNYEIKAGDILVSRGNTLELVGMATFIVEVRPRLLLCDLLYRFQARPERAEGAFLVHTLRAPNGRFQIEREATGTSPSMKKIGQGTIREFIVALPPLDEQRAIVAFIAAAAARLDTLIAESQRAIDLLQERRAALISAAVAGQIDVRGLADMEAA